MPTTPRTLSRDQYAPKVSFEVSRFCHGKGVGAIGNVCTLWAADSGGASQGVGATAMARILRRWVG